MSIIKTLKNHSYMFESLNDHPQGAIWSLLKSSYMANLAMRQHTVNKI
jgi:hypothetical protein